MNVVGRRLAAGADCGHFKALAPSTTCVLAVSRRPLRKFGVNSQEILRYRWSHAEVTAIDKRPRVVIVDTDRQRGKLIAVALDFMNMDVENADGLSHAMELINRSTPDAIVVGLTGEQSEGDMDGEQLLTRLRFLGTDAAVLLLSDEPLHNDVPSRPGIPRRASNVEIIVPGPDDLQLLTAAIRRNTTRLSHHGDSTHGDVRLGTLVLENHDLSMRVGEQHAHLSPTEGRLLRVLMTNADRVLPKSTILDTVWNYDFGGRTNIIETYVSYLRRKLSSIDGPPIETVRNAGYVMRSR